ncbi:MAG: transglutaminase domain-containing protein [bacterium]
MRKMLLVRKVLSMRKVSQQGKKFSRRYLFVVCLCMLFSGTGLTSTVRLTGTVNVFGADYPVFRQIQYSFTLQNRSNRLLKKAEFWTYGPVKQTATQRCVSIEASYPYQLITDDSGNQILAFSFENLPPYAIKIITIRAELEFSELSNQLPGQDTRAFLLAEEYIESDNPELSGFARGFQGPEPSKVVENIFHWITENIKYMGYVKNNRGALYAFRNRQGDCTEFMNLFIALCRANTIPARGIGGYVCPESSTLKAGEYHNWAEFFEDGLWKIADPQKKALRTNQSAYVAMMITGESSQNPTGKFSQFRFSGDGLYVEMMDE